MARRAWQGFLGALAVLTAVGAVSCSSGSSTGVVTEDASTGSHHLDGAPTVDTGCDGFCGTHEQCTVAADCASGVCKGGMCQAPSPTDGVKNDSETGVDCGGATLANGMQNPASDGAPPCANGQACNLASDCSSGSCQSGKCVAATCTDGVMDGMETDVDCGGPMCNPCPAGDKCLVARDCASDVCTNDVCQKPTDTDGVKNDSETDVDCGGALLANGMQNPMSDGAPVCATGKDCLIGLDCSAGVCARDPVLIDNLDGGVDAPVSSNDAAPGDAGTGLSCQPPTDHDGVKNDSETDVDCGGGLLAGGGANPASDGAPACAAGKKCSITLDCLSLVCTGGVCASPSATDGVKNDSETDVDCGGATLANGSPNPASDGAPACADGKSCALGTDCVDLVCYTGVITAAEASTNGSPINCPAGQTCTCQKPTDIDGVANDSETDVDCGGALVTGGGANMASDGAPVCAVGKKCDLGSDCVQGVCNGTMGAGDGPIDCPTSDACVCQAASPTDGVKNDSETDVDCGGALLASGATNPASDSAPACATGKACSLGTDCVNLVCYTGVITTAEKSTNGSAINCPAGSTCTCQAPTPNDGVKNDSETGIDCGGSASPASDGAPACADTVACLVSTDCLSGYCSTLSSTCVAGQSCVGVAASAAILDLSGNPDPNGAGQHAGLDTCGKGESTDATGQEHESCCRSLMIPSTVLPAGDAAGSRLDKYEVTAGRMRQFIETVNATEYALNMQSYDLQDYMAAQFDPTLTTATTTIGTRFAAQVPAGTTVKALIELMPSDWYGPNNTNSIVAELGGTTMDPAYPSTSQGCYVTDGADGATTYWWPATTNQMVTPVIVGGDDVGDGPRPYTQDYYDIKSMNCAPYWIYAAFCAWDGGHVATLAELDAVYGKQQYPWDTTGENTFLPADYTYTSVLDTQNNTTYHYQNFVPGTEYYTGAASTLGAVDLTVNWNNNSFGLNFGNFYYYPNGGSGPADQPAAVASGTDLSPYIAAPGRFYLDKTAILSPSGAGTEGWQDLGANMLEITSTGEGGSTPFCDCSTGGQATQNAACTAADNQAPPAGVANGAASCPGSTKTKLSWPVLRNGGAGLPSVRWEGGSWEGHETASPASAPYFSDSAYTETLQTQYGKGGFRCARAPE